MKYFQCGRFRFDLEGEGFTPLVMGILNVTPDSFSDGGRFFSLSAAVSHAEEMIRDGADIIDIGAESTRPGSDSVPLQEELDRIMPVVEALKDCGRPLSIDTCKPEVMAAVLSAGADMINDICGFPTEASREAVKSGKSGLCVMHMQGDPKSMQAAPHYEDVTGEVVSFLADRVERLRDKGVADDRICIDPGFGFGKTAAHNLTLLKHMDALLDKLKLPVLAGLSRKSLIGALTGKPADKRMAGSIAAALAAAEHGAAILRVHDVAETKDALKVWLAAR